MTLLQNRRLLKLLVLIVLVTCGILLGISHKQRKEKEKTEKLRAVSQKFNWTIDKKDPTLVYTDIGGNIVHPSRLYRANFSYAADDDPKYNFKSFNCLVEDWNKVHTDQLPNAELHEKWMKKNVSRKNYLYHTTPSPLAAFVHEDHITVTLTAENMFGQKVYCRYYDCNRREIPNLFEAVVFPESTVFCGRRIGAKYISVSTAPDSVPEPAVPLHKRLGGLQHYLTVCMATVYGEEPKFAQIVDFIEYHKLQGATFFHIYFRNSSAYDRMLLDDYVRTGEVEVIVMNDHYWRADFMWHMMQISDCHMRSKNFSKWTALLDIDERIEMRQDWRIVDYLDTVTNPNIINLQFSVQWVLKDVWSPERFENDTHFVDNLVFRRFHNTSRVANYWVQPKCIIRPEKIGAMTIHFPHSVYKGFLETLVNKTVGVVRHYRNVDGGALLNNNQRAFEYAPYRMTSINPTVEERLTTACLSRVKLVYDTVNYNCDMIQAMYHEHGLMHECYIKQVEEEQKALQQNQTTPV